jgi:hypothetical protein
MGEAMKSWGLYALAVLGFIIYGAVTEADRDSSGAIIDEGTVDAFQVRVGDCFDDVDSFAEEVSSLPGVPCSQPHDNEAYAVFDVSIATYPDDEAMWELANESCLERFESFVGMDYDSSSLDILTMYPTIESWKQNDREVVCAVYDINANKLVGSAKGRSL